jgi:hypothetical protein
MSGSCDDGTKESIAMIFISESARTLIGVLDQMRVGSAISLRLCRTQSLGDAAVSRNLRGTRGQQGARIFVCSPRILRYGYHQLYRDCQAGFSTPVLWHRLPAQTTSSCEIDTKRWSACGLAVVLILHLRCIAI